MDLFSLPRWQHRRFWAACCTTATCQTSYTHWCYSGSPRESSRLISVSLCKSGASVCHAYLICRIGWFPTQGWLMLQPEVPNKCIRSRKVNQSTAIFTWKPVSIIQTMLIIGHSYGVRKLQLSSSFWIFRILSLYST